MLMRAFRSLMPKEEGFVEHFAAHAAKIVAAADALASFMDAAPADREPWITRISEIEDEADAVGRTTIIALHRAFITPFDRSDIHALSNALDDAVDLIDEVPQRATLYGVTEFSPAMREFVGQIQKAGALLVELMPLLTEISKNASEISSLCERIGHVENASDKLLRQALTDLIAQRPDAIDFLGRKEVYDLLEEVTDRCDDVADIVQGIILDQV